MLQEGAFVFITGRTAKSVQPVIEAFQQEGFGDRAHGVVADCATKEGVEQLVLDVTATGRVIDIVVANLGFFTAKNFFDYEDDEWMQFFNTNVMSTVRICRQFLKPMLERNQGRIIIVSSEAGVRPIAGTCSRAH